MSSWLRAAGRHRLAQRGSTPLDTPEAVRAFFAALPDAETGHEPDWEQHLQVIAASRAEGGSGT